ncbi:MAG: hypothetical protein AB7Q97_13695 [Gammaproteobacteria bacterium]
MRGRIAIGLTLLASAIAGTGGCAAVGTIVTSEYMTGITVVSYLATGKGLSDHALGIATHEDCNVVSGVLSAERAICEPPGSLATGEDFRGLLAMLAEKPAGAQAGQITLVAPEALIDEKPPAFVLSPEVASLQTDY